MPTYPGISSEAFRHPLDREAERALRSFPGFDLLASKFVEFVYERPQFVYQMGNSIQIGPRQYASVYHIFRECLRDLDIYPEPTLFAAQSPFVNAYSLGKEQSSVILNTALLDLLDERELRCAIANELGHLKCGHTLLIQMGLWMISAAEFIGDLTFGIGNLIGSGLIYAFYEWRRRAELSADRAALLVMDELDPIFHTMMQMAGGSSKYAHECSLKEFVRQSERYQDLDKDELNQVYKFLLYNGGRGSILSHSFAVERLGYLDKWFHSAEYERIKSGKYPRSGESAVEAPAAEEEATEAERAEAEALRRQMEELQQEIDRLKARKARGDRPSES